MGAALFLTGCHDDGYYGSHHGAVYHGRTYTRARVYHRDRDYYDDGYYYGHRPYYRSRGYYSRPYRPAGAHIRIY